MIIYGAGAVGKVLYEMIGSAITCFIDDNPNKKEFCGLPVYRVDELDTPKDTKIILSVTDIGDVIERLEEYGYDGWTTYLAGLRLYRTDDHYIQYAVDMAIICQNAYVSSNLFLHSVDLIITERCSLRCKDCSNLMQYYEHPQDCDTKEILRSIDKLFNEVDEVGEVRVIGGEPFMNKDWHIIVKRLIDEPKVHRVVIYTNGTIMPKEMPQSDKILVFITDYGELSGKVDELVDSLNVPYHVSKASGWTACSDIRLHMRSQKENEKVFRSCCVRNLITLSNGRLHHCPFSANAVRLNKIPDCSVKISRSGIKKLLRMKDTLACYLCNGREYGAPEIQPAIQREV